ncbi:Pyoverdine/dityrosine biosynthesis protein-domain-containing protein [Podospora didyma]|uniref:Pyoverdine/dityrosine biosynthesis protein-domain-containing protein n=1 Tax=Podospora didyma TaxID=330526 RepID=A0AAE0TZZ9_9PEZI|nr:Pyoverdine/dityrosine biosynthesis protein-domain-containing protein [Podospora didyma]
MALTRLRKSVEEIEKIYEPGARIRIVSDGHVFSDCIGVDDATVDKYGAQLKEMNHMLMASFKPQESTIRAQIESQDAAILALYRGFSRFMLEDLETRPATHGLSRSQQRKLVKRTSFEMIMVRVMHDARKTGKD